MTDQTTNGAAPRAPSARPPEEPLLEVDGLTVEVGGRRRRRLTLVQDVTFDIGVGEVVGLVGESGSGKSVTSSALVGLLPRGGRIASGTVRLAGRELTSLPRRDLEDVRGDEIGLVFQDARSSLNPAFSVGEQIAETIRRHRDARRQASWERAVEILADVGIPNPRRRAHQYPHEFSGGMAQRAMLAIALACEPQVLIADEPTTALDVTIQRQILTLLREMQRDRDLSILFVSHDLGVIADLTDRVVVMYAGQVVEQAEVHELFRSPRHPYTEGLLLAAPHDGLRSTRRLPLIPGRPPRPGEMPQGCRFHPRCEYAEARCAAPEEIPLESVNGQSGRTSRCLRVHELELRSPTTAPPDTWNHSST